MAENKVLLEVLFKPKAKNSGENVFITVADHSWGPSFSDCLGIFQRLRHFEGSWCDRLNARLEVRVEDGWIIVFDLKKIVPPANMFYQPVKVVEMNAWSFAQIPEEVVRSWKTIEDVEAYVENQRR